MLRNEKTEKLSRRELVTLTVGILGLISTCVLAYWLYVADPYRSGIRSWADQEAHAEILSKVPDEVKSSIWRVLYNNQEPLPDYYCSATIISSTHDLEYLTIGHCLPSDEKSVESVTFTHVNGDTVVGNYTDCREYRESEPEDNVAICHIDVDSVPESMRALPQHMIDAESELNVDDQVWVAGYPGIINTDSEAKWYFDYGIVGWIGLLRDTGYSQNVRACASATVDGGMSGGSVYRDWQLVGVVSAMCDVHDTSGTVFNYSASITDLPADFWQFVSEFKSDLSK